MPKVQIRLDLRELRRERALRQEDLGSFWMVLQVEKGRRLPGTSTLARWSAKLGLPAPEVMAACRESHRRAMVARGKPARLVGHGRLSCVKRSGSAARKGGRS